MEKHSHVKLNKILTERGEKKALMELLNVSHPTVRMALNGEISSKKALRIRELALKRGAVEVVATSTKQQPSK